MAKGFNLTAEINLRGPSNVRNVIADIRRQLGTIDTAVTVKIDPQAANNANKLASVLTRLNNVLTTTSTQSRLTATNISQLANALNSFQTSANAASRSLGGLPRNIAQTTQNIQRAAQQTAAARTELEEFGRQSALAVRRFAAFSLATGAIYSLVNAVSKATKEFIEFDRQIVRLTQITGESYEQLGGLTRTITGLSTSLGVASSDLIGVADTLAQAGLSAKETEQALKALALTAVAPSFDSLNETVEGSIALMRQFSISTGDLEKALSSINSVAAAFAVESSDLITAIQRTGGVFASASQGVSEGTDALNEFLAIFTSVRATTRESAETIATGLRTIFTRIQRADTIEALKDYGVTLTDVEGKFVGAYRAVELLSQGLGRLDPRDLKFSQIVEELGGFRQIGKVLPLIQQFGTAQEALKTAYAGQGSLATDAAKAQAALSIQFAKTRENFVALIRDVGNSDSFRSLVEVGLTLANTFIKVASVAKPLLPILTSIAAVKGSEALYQFGTGFLGGFARQSPGSVGQNAGQALSGARNQQNAAAAVNNTRALSTNTNALQSLTSAVQQLNSSITNNRRTGPQTINSGGVVRAFARGGVVPGSGNSDTVPAMLQPGEFVIRKKAVETIGANNLHAMNKYGSGGSIRAGFGKRKRFAAGGRAKIADISDIEITDGDTFQATVTPTADPFTAKFRAWNYDAYETGDRPSRVSEQRLQQIQKIPSNKNKKFEKTSGGYLVEPDTRVFGNLTAAGAARDATVEFSSLLRQKLSSSKQDFISKINQDADEDGGFGRYKADLGITLPNPEKLTTGRFERKYLGGLIQKFAGGGLAGLKQVALRRVGIIDTDVLRDPSNRDTVSAEMEKLGLTDTSAYSIELAKRAAAARKSGSLLRLRAIAGAAGSGKSSLATGLGVKDDANLRITTRSQILTPQDIANVDEVLVLTSTASDSKLDAYLRDVDRAYVLSSSSSEERQQIESNRERRDTTGQGLYGRKPGTTRGATTDFALDETILREELGPRAMVLGRKEGSYGLRRKRENELPEIVQAGGFYTGGFAPPTRGHRGALNSLLARMMKQNPNASIEDIVVSVAPNLPMASGEGETEAEQLAHASRYGIFPSDFRALLSQINFGGAMISTQDQPPGSLPKFMEVAGTEGRRRFARLRGAMAVTSGKEEGVLGKYQRAGIQVEDIPRIEDISATKVREALFKGDDALLQEYLDPQISSILMGNRVQLRNRSLMVPMLLEKIKEVVEVEKANSNAEVDQLLASAPGGPYKNVSAKLRENAPEVAEQVRQIRSQRDMMARGAFGYRAYNVIQALASKYPELYALDPNRRAAVSASVQDIDRDLMMGQVTESMAGVFPSLGAQSTLSPIQESILARVQKETASRGSGALPASNQEILKTLGASVIPDESRFGKFAGKSLYDHLKLGKKVKTNLPYWFSDYKTFMRRPGEITGLTEEDVATYAATRDYVIDLFNKQKRGSQQSLLESTAQQIAQTQMLAIVGLRGKNGLQGPLTWNLGNNAAGEPVSVSATIMERVLPAKYKAVADYITEQTGSIVQTAAGMMTESGSLKSLDLKKREVLNQGNIEGGIFEQLIATLGADVLDDAVRTRAIDFPGGIGETAAKVFGIDANIPTEAKRTIDSTSRAKAMEEFQRYFRGIYGVPEPAGDLVQQFARGGKVDDLLVKYKDIIKSIMPAEYIADDGFLKLPGGGSLQTSINYDPGATLSQSISSMLGFGSNQRASASGVSERVLLYNLRKNKDSFSPTDFQTLEQWLASGIPSGMTVSVGKTSTNALSHEAFHTIQGYLAENYPDKYALLNNITNKYKTQVLDIYKTSAIKNGKYSAKSLFPQKPRDSAYYGSYGNLRSMAPNSLGSIVDKTEMDLSTNEIIPLLISASQQYNDSRATKLLEAIFTEAGLNSNFADTMPKGYFWGGKVDPLAKKYGLSQSEFEEQKKIAKFMGLNDKDFEEKLRLFAAQKQRIKGAKFATLDALADTSVANQRVTAEQQALNEFLQTNKFADGGAATLDKPSKNYGKISITEDGNTISAGYLKGSDRSGYVNAYKMRDYLYYVGLSKATSGYGPRLYDVVMEAATEKGAMLTSDRSSVSGDAKRVWAYYFKNRGDVKKTPLKPDDWTRNQADIDPKLYGREETWPPATDPAWILQSGYSKSPSLINDPSSVIKTNRKQDSRSMALEYFQRAAAGGSIRRFANGGSPEDTVPALLTPGEFVINKKAAQSIGYGKLNRLNQADKLQGYNKGGTVGIQRFKVGGDVASDAQLTAISDEMSKALRTLPDSIREVVREFNIQTTKLSLGDSFDKINLKLRQQMAAAQKDIENLGPEVIEGIRKVLGAGIRRLDNIELDIIRSSPEYKGPGKEYYEDVEKARAGRKVFESGASGVDNVMDAMARSVGGVGEARYPKPIVSVPKMKPEDYYSKLNYSDVGGSGNIRESGRRYAQALAGEDPLKIEALVAKLRKEMEEAAQAAGISIGLAGKSQSWAYWDVGKQLYMQQNPEESTKGKGKYRLGNPLTDAQIQKEIVQRHLGYEASKKNASGVAITDEGLRRTSENLKDLGARIMEQIEATKAQTDATKTQTENTQKTFPFMAGGPTPSGPTGPGGQRTFAFMSDSGAPDPYTGTLSSGIRYNPLIRRIRRNTRENDPRIQERYQTFASSTFNRSIEQLANRALALGAGLSVPLESLSQFAGSSTVAGKTLSSLSQSASSLSSTFYQSVQAIRAFANFADSRFGQRLLGQFAQSLGTANIGRFFNQRRNILGNTTTLTQFGTGIAAGAAAAVALTQAFVDYSNALKESRIEEAQKRQEEALTKSAEALEKYRKNQDRASLMGANASATSAAVAALDEANARSMGDRRFGARTGAAVGAGAIGGGLLGQALIPIPVLGAAIGAAIGGTLSGGLAQYFNADRQRGATAEETARSFGQTRSRLNEVFAERFTSGETSEDIMGAPEWNKQRELLARSNAGVEAIIRAVEADTSLSEETRKARVQELMQLEASKQLREQEQIWLKQKGLIDLDNATKAYTRSLRNMFANMDEAINRSSLALENFNTSIELAEASVKGQARIGMFKSENINIIRNPRASSEDERLSAANAAGSFFGSESGTISKLLTVGPKIESAVLAAIQAAQTLPGSTTDEAIAAAIRRSVRDELSSSSLPQELSDKLGQQIAAELEKRRKSGDDKVDFRDLEEAIPQLKDSVDALRGAQDVAIKALEDYTQKVGIFVDKANTSVELLVQAGELLRKASEVRFGGQQQLNRAFGASTRLEDIRDFRDFTISRQTGGASTPEDILNNINRLENRRVLQQNQLQSATDRGRSGVRDVLGFTDQLSRTTRSLRDNQKALEDLATNSELASAALEKISELQAKTQAGQNIIERYLTSTREDNFKLSAAFERLENNMRGMTNNPLASRNVFEAMRDSDNPALAADQAIAQDRRDTLEAFNMLAPFLGDTREQNVIKANVLETMLQEAGIGMTPMFNEVIKSLRNPENNPEMMQLVEQYKEGIKIQVKANELLAELNTNFAQNIKQSSEEAFKNAITDTLVKFEEAQVGHLQKIEEILSKQQTPATGLAQGGVVYRNIGGSIFQPKGTDTVPAMLTPGEFVVNKASTQKYGSVLNEINSNRYANGGKVKYYADGGYVSPTLKSQRGFTTAASEAAGYDANYYQPENGPFSKNRHYAPKDLAAEIFSTTGSSPVKIVTLGDNASVIPTALQPVSSDKYPVSDIWSLGIAKHNEQFRSFINNGVTATSVAIGSYPEYVFGAMRGSPRVYTSDAKSISVTPEGVIPQSLFLSNTKRNLDKKKKFLSEKEVQDIPLMNRISTELQSAQRVLSRNDLSIYDSNSFSQLLANQISEWNDKGATASSDYAPRANLNNLSLDTLTGGKKAAFMLGAGLGVLEYPLSQMNTTGKATGLSTNDMQIVSGFVNSWDGGAGGFTVDVSSKSREKPKVSVFSQDVLFSAQTGRDGNYMDNIRTILDDFNNLKNDVFGEETIYSEQYKIYQEALASISQGMIERAKFSKNILNETEVSKLSSIKGDNIDISKLNNLYVWSKRAFDPDRIKNNPKFKNATNIGVDFPIEDINNKNTQNFVWSLSDTLTGSQFLESIKPFLDPKQYVINETFSKTFDAPWATDKKINIEFPFKILKKLPLFDNASQSINKEYSGFGLYSDTFNMLGDNKTFNPFKLQTKDYNYDGLILAKSNVYTVLSDKIKQWINSNGGQVPTEAVDLQLLDKLVQVRPEDLDLIPEDNDLSRETIASRRDILGAKGNIYQQLANIGVLYRGDGEANFSNLDLDPSMVDDFKNRVGLDKTFATGGLNQGFPAYADGLLNIKNEIIKSKQSLIEDFINQSNISNLNLSEIAPWVKNLQDSRVGDLFNAGPEVPNNLRQVYLQTLAWDKTQKTADLMNDTEAKYPNAFQELMSLLQLGFYVNGGKTPSAATSLANEFNNLQQGFFGTENLDKLSVYEDSKVAGKRGKQWWKSIGPNWAGFAKYNLSIIARKSMVENIQNILNRASQTSFNQQDANALAEDIESLSLGAGAQAKVAPETPAQNLVDLISKALDTTKIYTEGYRLDIGNAIQRFNMPAGVNEPELDRIKAMLDPSSDLMTYLSFKDAILGRPISKVAGIKVQGDDRDIKAPRLSSYATQDDEINGFNPWSVYKNFLDNANFTNISNAFNDITSTISSIKKEAGLFRLQDPTTLYKGPSNTFDGKPYVDPTYEGADPIRGTGAYASAYKALAGTIYETLFEKNKAGETTLDNSINDPNMIYRSSGGSIPYYTGGGSIVNFKPKGTDTVPAMLTPGEFVINRQATQKHLPLLQAINSQNYQTGGFVQYLQRGSTTPVQQQASQGWFRQFVDWIRSSSDEDILGFGNPKQTMTGNRFKQFLWDISAGGWAGFGSDIPMRQTRLMPSRPNKPVRGAGPRPTVVQATYQPSARSLASRKNREEVPYIPPAEDPTAYSPSSRAEASRRAREAYKPQYSAEAYIGNAEAAQASQKFIEEYNTRKEAVLKRELMLEEGPISSINLATPFMTFEGWDKKSKTQGRIVAYDAARQFLAILKVAGTDILDPDRKVDGVTSFPINLLGPSSQEAIFALLNNRELSSDDPYPYQKVGINEAISKLEKTYGTDFVKSYRDKNRVRKINTNAGQVYDPNQGYIESKLSNFLLAKAIEKQKKFALPTAEAMPEPEPQIQYTSKTEPENKPFPQQAAPKPQTRVSDETLVFGQEMRKWIDSSGKFSVIAKLVSFLNQNKDVKLNKTNNKNVIVPIDKFSSADKAYLDRVRSNKAAAIKPTLQPEQLPAPVQKSQAFANIDRLWYGGRSWDLNNDGIESEKIFGRINRILDAERIMIDTNSVPGGQLILRRQFMNQEDLDVIKAWENQRRMVPVNRQNGGIIYASNGQLVNFQPRGTDTIPAMLTPGEFVVNRQATQKNLPLLQTMNNGGVIYRRNGSTGPEGRKTFRDYQVDMQGNPAADKYIDRDALAKDYAGRDTKYWWKIFKEGQEAYNRIVGSLLVKDIDPNQPDNTRRLIGNENYMSVNNQTGVVTQVKSPTLTTQGIPDYINEYNRNNFHAPKKANKDLWSEAEKREYMDAYNLGSQRNAVQAEKKARENAENKAARAAFMYDYGITPEEQQKKDNLKATRDRAGADYLRSLGLPGTTDEAMSMFYGVSSKALPAIAGVATAGLAMGVLAPLALPGGALLVAGILAGMAGDRIGEMSNKFVYDNFISPDLKKDIEQKMSLYPEEYETGTWIGLGAEIAAGAKFAPMLSKQVEKTILSAADAYARVGLTGSQISSAAKVHAEEIAALTARKSSSIVIGPEPTRGAEPFFQAIIEESRSKAMQQGVEKLLPNKDDKTQSFANGGLVSELSGLYQRRLTAQKDLAAARDQWFVVPLKENRPRGSEAGDTSKIFDSTGNILPVNEILTYSTDKLAVLYGRDSKALKEQAQTKYPWFDKTKHRLVMGQGIYRNQKQAFSKQDPALKLIDQLAYEYNSMPNVFEIKNKEAYTDEAIDKEAFLNSLKDKKGAYVASSVKPASEMLKNRSNFLTALFYNLEEGLDIVDEYLNRVGRGETARAVFAGEDPDRILSIQKGAVSSELDNIDKILQEAEINKYANNVKNDFNKSRILDFTKTKNLKSIFDYFTKSKKPEQKPTEQQPPTGPIPLATGGFVPRYYSSGSLIDFSPRGTDTVPAMLTPGEFVINKQATQKHLPLLKQINSQSYQRGGVVRYYQQGTSAPVQPANSGLGSMYSLSLDDKSISLIREFTSKFAEFSNKLANLVIPSLKIDESSLASLNNFTQRFDNFTKELLKLNIPPVITITGKHEVNVNINGASVFSNMDKYVSNMIKNEINNAFAQLARETDGAISMNYNPSAYSNQNTQNMA